MKKPKPIDLFKEIPLSEKNKKEKNPAKSATARRFITEYYKPRYLELFGLPPRISWGKDVKLLTTIIKTYPDVAIYGCENHLSFLIRACEKYFVSKDSLALKNAWSIGIFFTNIDKIVLSLKNVEEGVIYEVMEGYKLAFFNHTGNKFDGSLVGKEETFSYIYLIIKPFWKQYGNNFSMKRFAELYFLVLLVYTKEKVLDLNFFVSKFAQDKFQNWLETEGKELLMFFPREIGNKSKEFLEQQHNIQKKEEAQLLYK